MSVDLQRFLIFVGILAAVAVVAMTSKTFRPYLRKNPVITFLLAYLGGFR